MSCAFLYTAKVLSCSNNDTIQTPYSTRNSRSFSARDRLDMTNDRMSLCVFVCLCICVCVVSFNCHQLACAVIEHRSLLTRRPTTNLSQRGRAQRVWRAIALALRAHNRSRFFRLLIYRAPVPLRCSHRHCRRLLWCKRRDIGHCVRQRLRLSAILWMQKRACVYVARDFLRIQIVVQLGIMRRASSRHRRDATLSAVGSRRRRAREFR